MNIAEQQEDEEEDGKNSRVILLLSSVVAMVVVFFFEKDKMLMLMMFVANGWLVDFIFSISDHVWLNMIRWNSLKKNFHFKNSGSTISK